MEDFLSGPKNHLYMKKPTIDEFKLALAAAAGRKAVAGKFLRTNNK
jgi:hypothetical protein